MDIQRKLAILAGAAKYDASCASGGVAKRGAATGQGLGSTERSGICHGFGPDGRCISLLKVLFTNWCVYDCRYCVNRWSSDIPRARFRIDELVRLTLDFYRRNLIEGLFLSSGIIRDPDYTMEQVIEVARCLREEHGFRGYIHLKAIPNASEELVLEAGRYADRLSVNIELPTPAALARLAPEKEAGAIERAMAQIRSACEAGLEGATVKARCLPATAPKPNRPPRFAPAGQSTQMIVGADGSNDRAILETSAALYSAYRLKRVYYSAFSPIPRAPPNLPLQAAPPLREHRLYQADWLLRFYGFQQQEIVTPDGMLSLDMDPKLAWALAHPSQFPVDLNRAPKERLLRVPGLGVRSVGRLLAARRLGAIRRGDLDRLSIAVAKVLPFVVLPDHRPRDGDVGLLLASRRKRPRATQLELFADP